MAECVLLSIEGVLSKEGPPNGQPIETGLRLYFGLKTMFKVVLSTTCTNNDWVEHWLSVNSIRDQFFFLGIEEEEPYTVRTQHIYEARRQKYQLALVVDADPQVCAEAVRLGLTAMLFTHPRYARPEQRPDYERAIKPWSEIEEEVTVQRRKIVIDADMEPQDAH